MPAGLLAVGRPGLADQPPWARRGQLHCQPQPPTNLPRWGGEAQGPPTLLLALAGQGDCCS